MPNQKLKTQACSKSVLEVNLVESIRAPIASASSMSTQITRHDALICVAYSGIPALVSQDIAAGTASVATLDRKGAVTCKSPPLPSRRFLWADGYVGALKTGGSNEASACARRSDVVFIDLRES
jgi:hypothetical protein